jgi:hypothetical protein
MEYRIYPNYLSGILIVFIVMIWNILGMRFGFSLFLFLFVLVFGILLASFRFTYTLKESLLFCRIYLFGKTLFKMEIHPKQVEEMKFIRTGWAKKSVVVKRKKGLDHRFTVLEGEEVGDAHSEFLQFARENDIKFNKTKDYKLLERMSRAAKES